MEKTTITIVTDTVYTYEQDVVDNFGVAIRKLAESFNLLAQAEIIKVHITVH